MLPVDFQFTKGKRQKRRQGSTERGDSFPDKTLKTEKGERIGVSQGLGGRGILPRPSPVCHLFLFLPQPPGGTADPAQLVWDRTEVQQVWGVNK